nr:DUF2961 domain-containing protein [Candidatus Sigynarchaeota archaeon]
PFKKEARVVIANTSEKYAIIAFYGAITYRQYDASFSSEPYYFHAIYREESLTKQRVPYKIVDVKGDGFYAGVVLNIKNAKRGHGFMFLEGNTKVFVDGEATPSIEYTGTEDLFQGAWYYVTGEFYAPYSGLTVRSFSRWGMIRGTALSYLARAKTSQYRFHEQDTIPFKKSLLVHIHHGEFDEILTNESSVAYFYARKPVMLNMFPLEQGDFKDEYYTH